MPLHASKLDLLSEAPPLSSSSSSHSITSILFEPFSCSLALSLSDSSHILFPSFSPSSPPYPPTSVPPSSTASFLRLLPSDRVLFLTASPLEAGASVILRAWILLLSSPPSFSPTRLTYEKTAPAAIPLAHGFGVRLIGTANYFLVHSPAARQIWVMAARLEKGGEGEMIGVDLMKCAVVECDLPIYSIGMSTGVIVLGEIGGVRVFPLRVLVKGSGLRSRRKKSGDRLLQLEKRFVPNGMIVPTSFADDGAVAKAGEEKSSGKTHASEVSSDSSRSAKYAHMLRVDVKMKVQVLSVPPNIFTMVINESPEKDGVEDEEKEKSMRLSAAQVIFTSEKVQHIIAVSAKAILVLGQGNIFAYSIF